MGHYPTPVTRKAIDDWSDGWHHANHWRIGTAVYILRDLLARTIYVGMTDRPRQRMRAHARKWWWPAVDLGMSELLVIGDRDEARAVERFYIADLLPPMNTADRGLAELITL